MSGLQRYTCEEAFRRLDDYLDRELGPEEMRKVREHLETCEACATEFKFEESVLQHVRSKVQRINAPQALREKLANLLQAERASGQ